MCIRDSVGVTRHWDCTCAVVSVRPACPVHSIIRQMGRVRDLAVSFGRPLASMPLFPSESGDEVDRCAAVGSIFVVAELTGAEFTDAFGAYQYGGHSLRTGGLDRPQPLPDPVTWALEERPCGSVCR